MLVNGAYFVASGQGVEVKYEKAYSVEPKSAAYIDQLVLNSGVLGSRSFLLFLLVTFTFFSFSPFCVFTLYLNFSLLKLLVMNHYQDNPIFVFIWIF